MISDSPQGLLLALVFLLPGYLAERIEGKLRPLARKDSFELFTGSLALSAILHVISFVLVSHLPYLVPQQILPQVRKLVDSASPFSLLLDDAQVLNATAKYLGIVFGLAFLWGVLRMNLRIIDVINNLSPGAVMGEPAWYTAFHKLRQEIGAKTVFVHVTMASGEVYSGQLRAFDIVEGQKAKELVLVEAARLRPDGTWEHLPDDGMIIHYQDVALIRFTFAPPVWGPFTLDHLLQQCRQSQSLPEVFSTVYQFLRAWLASRR